MEPETQDILSDDGNFLFVFVFDRYFSSPFSGLESSYNSADSSHSEVETDSEVGSSDEDSEEEVIDMRMLKSINCTNCGAKHRNAPLADTYRNCHFCNKFLRQVSINPLSIYIYI